MICPHCHSEFETPAGHCPDCGIRIVRKICGVMKTSSVIIAAGEESGFYRSVQEVPELLRRRLIETTNSENSGMIVIADRAGKEQWTEIVAHREARQALAASEEPDCGGMPSTTPARGFAGLSWSAWVGVLLFLAAATMIASVFRIVRW